MRDTQANEAFAWQEQTLPIVRVVQGGQVLAQLIFLAQSSKTVPSPSDD